MQLAAIRGLNASLPVVIGWTVLVVMLPFVLEWTEVIDRTYWVQGGAVISSSDVFDMRRSIDEVVLVAVNPRLLASAAIVAVFISRRRFAAQRELQVHAWHLRQLLPAAKK